MSKSNELAAPVQVQQVRLYCNRRHRFKDTLARTRLSAQYHIDANACRVYLISSTASSSTRTFPIQARLHLYRTLSSLAGASQPLSLDIKKRPYQRTGVLTAI